MFVKSTQGGETTSSSSTLREIQTLFPLTFFQNLLGGDESGRMTKTRKRGKIPQGDWPLIVARYQAGESFASIARTYNCSPPAISYIVSRSRLNDSRTLPPPHLRPKAIEGVPSAFDYAWSDKKTIILKSSSANIPPFPFPFSERDHAKRLETCRTLAEDLAGYLEQRSSNIRDDYRAELKNYTARLPSHREDGNILLADAASRTLRNLFAAEADFLPAGIAARLKTFLEQHIGLRPYYPELEIFYRDVKSGRL